MDLADFRKEYSSRGLHREDLDPDPVAQFSTWFQQAIEVGVNEPNAMTLATVDESGMPFQRTVLLKYFDTDGFVFFTNSESRKGRELKANPQACLNFYWMPLGRQIRISGKVEQVSDAESDAYFAQRRRGSQIASMASDQSRVLESFQHYLDRVSAMEQEYEGKEVVRPAHWHGWRVIPEAIEFWEEGDYRMHQRELFTREKHGWKKVLLYP